MPLTPAPDTLSDRIHAALCRYWREHGECPTVAWLASECDCAESTVHAKLVSHPRIEHRPGKHNAFRPRGMRIRVSIAE